MALKGVVAAPHHNHPGVANVTLLGEASTMPVGPALRRALHQLLGEQAAGLLDFVRPGRRRELLALRPFNSQTGRHALFSELVTLLRPCAILETGTWLGATTELFAATGLPVYSVESNPRSYAFARARLWPHPNVRVAHSDSRSALRRWVGPDGPWHQTPVLAYLDAHWGSDLPLAAELDILFGGAPQAVALIDDFAVPDDPGYGFDTHGEATLNATYIAPLVSRHDLTVFYPALPSASETGARRGAAVICQNPLSQTLGASPVLRRAPPVAAHHQSSSSMRPPLGS